MVVRFFFCVDLVPVATAAASQTRNQEKTCPKVRKGEIGRSTSIGAMTMVKSFEVTELPVRSAKFIARKQWVVAGADDMFIRVYNYNTMDKVKVFEAHTDYIRCVAVHPTLPYVLSSSDDMLIKLWDWEKGWICTQIFEGHSHYVMQVTFNPKDTNTFASASLDRTVKIWNLASPDPNFTLDAHSKGVNCVDYFTGGDRPYLITGSDDQTAKVWDYQTKSCIQTLEGHTHNVSAVCFHPELPIIITGSEDGTVRIWHATTYRLENALNYGLERVWAVGYIKRSRRVVIGYDEGTIMVKIGREVPVASMDNSGKIIWAKHNEIQTVNIKTIGADFEVTDGERLPLAVKELGSCDLYPQSVKHNPNGRFVVVCGDGEYIIYTALAWRNRSFGSALEFVWSSDGEYAIRESTSKIKIFSKTFQNLYWADSGDLLVIASDTSFYILKYKRDVVFSYLESGKPVDDQGVEDAFELLHEVNERVRTGIWVGDCFIYNNSSWRLNYCVGGEVTTMFHLDRPMYLLGYLASQSRVYLIDKEFNVMCYTLLLSLIEYKTLVMRGDLERANEVLPSIPQDHHNSVAHFLESRGMLEDALEVATDPNYRFDLAVQLGRLEIAKAIAMEVQSESKWKQLGELAMSTGKLEMAEECLSQAVDLSGLLLLYSALGDAEGITKLASLAKEQGKNNVAFLCLFMLGKLEDCLELLVESNRIPEAALMARSYLPSKVSEIVSIWKKDLNKVNPKASESLADPEEYPNLFEDWQVALAVESNLAHDRGKYAPAEEYLSYAEKSEINLVEVFKSMQVDEERLPLENGDSGHELEHLCMEAQIMDDTAHSTIEGQGFLFHQWTHLMLPPGLDIAIRFLCSRSKMMEEDVIEEGQDEAVEHDVNDSTDSTVPFLSYICSHLSFEVPSFDKLGRLSFRPVNQLYLIGSAQIGLDLRSNQSRPDPFTGPVWFVPWLTFDQSMLLSPRLLNGMKSVDHVKCGVYMNSSLPYVCNMVLLCSALLCSFVHVTGIPNHYKLWLARDGARCFTSRVTIYGSDGHDGEEKNPKALKLLPFKRWTSEIGPSGLLDSRFHTMGCHK
ncbi:hypothetical protein MUK42_11205 [Musa troglodytarum]|uniref:Uncharacterized protein n=1 Tax=Musa troglodytarum TaxID=320322 RepID=A0A9E7GV08_9LILI|nr:hypothetical protein MUK42_11205 [Musa troglodytarum]